MYHKNVTRFYELEITRMSQEYKIMYHKNVENICVVLLLTYLLTRMLQDFMSYKSQECHKIGV